ncbi:uncharacterized protein DUF1656 [Vreelandella songnenensis]|uniref:Uncharacterized protein DUF1656 n=1 Tax=Vreelandella songnenensis TaxID=1176243 RepID=A0A2T0V4X4_9GAMM|nr:DUF1656 domain-containing protein [Halomonas songnenensis]PRY65232.1 uncharacterized protein DUF1656 [Halomonas songnenensis]
MGLQEIAFGGIYLSPLLIFALLGFVATLAIRTLLHWLLGQHTLWYAAWFDLSLFVILTAGITFVFTILLASP